MNKHRKGGVKREHACLPGVRLWCALAARLPGVHSVIPGRIYNVGANVGWRARVSVRTPTGVKVLLRSQSAVQEVFVVSADPVGVEKRLRAHCVGGER